MSDGRLDQASGMRRLFGRRAAQWSLAITGAGGTTVTLNLASALARQGQRVLILDRSRGEAATALGLSARYELAHVLDGDKTLREVLLEGPEGITLLPAARGLARCNAEGATREHLANGLGPDAAPFDVWLVNGLPPPAEPGRETDLLLVAAPTQESITRAYTLLKEIAREGVGQRFRLVVDRAPSESAALATYRNVADAARRFLCAQLDYCGYLPHEGGPRRMRVAGHAAQLVDALSPRGHAFALLAASVVPGSAPMLPRALPIS